MGTTVSRSEGAGNLRRCRRAETSTDDGGRDVQRTVVQRFRGSLGSNRASGMPFRPFPAANWKIPPINRSRLVKSEVLTIPKAVRHQQIERFDGSSGRSLSAFCSHPARPAGISVVRIWAATVRRIAPVGAIPVRQRIKIIKRNEKLARNRTGQPAVGIDGLFDSDRDFVRARLQRGVSATGVTCLVRLVRRRSAVCR